ncbi:MAG TPA: sigma-70 family RNA polymerase sigma factor [Baekduia sp.]|uniref:RNA polymerase sigma factor n=1 Tax=Baekduia sp. TaxID=2600305 RepID=UPI002D07E700|nr:sigma-70 family RNA polymerase sigma factor [Baekduia sp.]HMJ33071.1 sigma-70 family RNA polymerase sigma factor [Baekduia sp.]
MEEWRVRRLVVAARSGDREAMRELYVLHAAAVHAHVLRVVDDVHDADDVTQQVFAKLLTGLDRYRPGEAPFVAWVLRVAHNTAIDHVRRARTVSVDEVDEPEARDDRRAEEARTSLHAALASLPQAQRDVLLLTHLVGLSPQEIADLLGRSVRAVHGLHYRGRAAAQSALSDLGSAPTVAAMPHRRPQPAARVHALSA